MKIDSPLFFVTAKCFIFLSRVYLFLLHIFESPDVFNSNVWAYAKMAWRLVHQACVQLGCEKDR